MASLGEILAQLEPPPLPEDYDPDNPIDVAWRQFERGLRRTKKGSLCRDWKNQQLVIFRKNNGYCWCVIDSLGRAEYSRKSYEDEEEATRQLFFKLHWYLYPYGWVED